jgi:hypothetical protein
MPKWVVPWIVPAAVVFGVVIGALISKLGVSGSLVTMVIPAAVSPLATDARG